jgi:hypothetical protein
MNEIVDKIKEPWDLMRVLRLGFGGYILVNSLVNAHYWLTFMGALFLFQAITNTGCFGGSCAPTSPSSRVENESDDIDYEELAPRQKTEL